MRILAVTGNRHVQWVEFVHIDPERQEAVST